jgi:hypothetical protein
MALQYAPGANSVPGSGKLGLAPNDGKTALIQALVSHLTAGMNGSDATRQAYQARLLSFAMRLLTSNLASSHPGDAASIVQAIKHKMYQQQRDREAARSVAASACVACSPGTPAVQLRTAACLPHSRLWGRPSHRSAHANAPPRSLQA